MNDKYCLWLGWLLLAVSFPAAEAQYYARGYAGGGSSMGGSAPFGGSLPFGGGTTQFYNPSSGYASPGIRQALPFASPYGYGNSGYPAFNALAPAPLGLGLFRFGALSNPYWRAPSGYYYPVGIGATTFGYGNPIYYINQSQSQPMQEAPPLYALFSDMQQYLDQSSKEGRVSASDYQHLFRRLQDLRGKYDHLIAMNGTLDQNDEESIRKDVGMLGSEIATRTKPMVAPSKNAGATDGQATSDKTSSKSGNNQSGFVEESK